jgi:hypothetical protein
MSEQFINQLFKVSGKNRSSIWKPFVMTELSPENLTGETARILASDAAEVGRGTNVLTVCGARSKAFAEQLILELYGAEAYRHLGTFGKLFLKCNESKKFHFRCANALLFSRTKPRAGIDPATYGLQGRCSTGLSYRGAQL